MPRIAPDALLKCLSVLLSNDGGILSFNEVDRIVSLMIKFSKKLVSKTIYLHILQSTEDNILDSFMDSGGWDLVFNWFSEGIQSQNWPVVSEVCTVLLKVRVDIERLKRNDCPKVVKLLTRNTLAPESVQQLASQIVEKWLAIVKGACTGEVIQQSSTTTVNVEKTGPSAVNAVVVHNEVIEDAEDNEDQEESLHEEEISIADEEQNQVQKVESTKIEKVKDIKHINNKEFIAVIGGKKFVTRIIKDESSTSSSNSAENIVDVPDIKAPNIEDPKVLSKKRLIESEKNKKYNEKFKVDDKFKSRNREKDRYKDIKSKIDKNKEKSKKEEQESRDKATLEKLSIKSLASFGKIPKKVTANNSPDFDKLEKKLEEKKTPVEPPKPPPKDPKKYNISLISTKKQEIVERPKIVKTFNSKFRSTGLEEAPPLPTKKRKESIDRKSEDKKLAELKASKRSSPSKDVQPVVPEKKLKEDSSKKNKEDSEKKSVTPTKPKSLVLLESDFFGDALTAANLEKNIKKRKRRASLTTTEKKEKEDVKREKDDIKKEKDEVLNKKEKIKEVVKNKEKEGSPPDSDETLANRVKKEEEFKPKFKGFYKDTLDETLERKPKLIKKESEDSEEENDDNSISDTETTETISEAIEIQDKQTNEEEKNNAEKEKARLPQGVLVYVRKKSLVKKTVSWKNNNLEEIRYFELDESERVNVSKSFSDFKTFDKLSEKDVSVLLSRKLAFGEDLMEEKTPWRPLVRVHIPFQLCEEVNSMEKITQAARENYTIAAIYFSNKKVPDSPAEPDLEIHAKTEPLIAPIDDQHKNPEAYRNYKDIGWPEPKCWPPGTVAQTIDGGTLIPVPQIPNAPLIPVLPGPPPVMDFNQQPMGPSQIFQPNFQGPPPSGPMMNGGDWCPPPNDPNIMMPPGPRPNFMGGPPQMGPPPSWEGGPGPSPHMFQLPPMGPPPQMGYQPNMYQQRPWFPPNQRQQNPGGPWCGPSKGKGWTGKPKKVCKYIIEKGYCNSNTCSFLHPNQN